MTTTSTTGRLRLTVIEAKLTRDTDFFSKMDPYCIIKSREQTFKTKVMQNAGKMPKWNEIFDINVKYIGDDMSVEVLDEDVTSSDQVGITNIKLSSLCMNGGIDEWFDLQYKGKKSGSVHLKGDWRPDVPEAAKVQVASNMLGAFMSGQQMQQPQYYAQPHMMQQPMYAQPAQPMGTFNTGQAMNALNQGIQQQMMRPPQQPYGMPAQ